jgi:hypothetical protein
MCAQRRIQTRSAHDRHGPTDSLGRAGAESYTGADGRARSNGRARRADGSSGHRAWPRPAVSPPRDDGGRRSRTALTNMSGGADGCVRCGRWTRAQRGRPLFHLAGPASPCRFALRRRARHAPPRPAPLPCWGPARRRAPSRLAASPIRPAPLPRPRRPASPNEMSKNHHRLLQLPGPSWHTTLQP